jgi:excisionase family DNA binding protein
MYVNVQRAARSLGVSPQTVRRWTSSGFLPCTRTPGGHRRIKQEDLQELAALIGGSNHLAARQARERELEVLVESSIALAGELELPMLLKEIARRLTALLDCHYCDICTYDADADLVVMQADYDYRGRQLPTMQPYPLSRFPCTRTVLEERRAIVVNVGDRRADAAEVSELIAGGDRSLLMVPLVYRGRSMGLIELIDHERERHYSRQELRLCSAIAGLAAAALHNAQMFLSAKEGEASSATLLASVRGLRASLSGFAGAADAEAILGGAATAACQLPGVLSCVASAHGLAAGAMADAAEAQPHGRVANGEAHVVRAPDDDGVQLTLSLARAMGEADLAYLELVAELAGVCLRKVQPREEI